MKKWNFKTLEYEEYTVPDDWKIKTFSTDMEEKVNCAACGKLMEYGDGYTSRTIHTKKKIRNVEWQDRHDQQREEQGDYENKSKD